MLTESSQTRVAGCLLELHKAGWVITYCWPELLAEDQAAIRQLLSGLDQMPLPIEENALVISDNGDIYGTVRDLTDRAGW